MFAAEQVKGKAAFLDPQTGNENCGSYFENATKNIIVVRIDNLKPNDLMKECAESRAG